MERGARPRWGMMLAVALAALIVLGAVFLPQLVGHLAPSKQDPTATPAATRTNVSGFPVTSAELRNNAGIDVSPGMRPSVYPGPNPDGWWCIPPNCFTPSTDPVRMINREMALAARLHVAVLRVEFDWPVIEPKEDVYRWSPSDAVVLAADRYKIQLQPVLVYTPTWAGQSPFSAPTQERWWTDFVRRVVSRYRNSVHYWEMWNEPDGGGYWLDGEATYVHNILVPGSQAVKAADPSARVLLGEPYYADTAFLKGIYANGGGAAFDIAGFHEYANVLSQTAIQNDIDSIQSILDQHEQGHKPIWIGEYGYREPSETTSDTEHITAMQIMLQQVGGYQEALWYNLRDDYAMTCCPPAVARAGYWGLVQHDGVTLKKGYTAMLHIIVGLPH